MKKETPNCAKCKWYYTYLACTYCRAVGGKSASTAHGTPLCKKLYEPKDEVAK